MRFLNNTNLSIILGWMICHPIFFGCHTPNSKTQASAISDSLKIEKKITAAKIKISESRKNILTGDLILRTGNDFTSESLRSLNKRDQTYSHCGIASIENDSIFIYLSIGGDWNPDQKIKREPFESFAEPATNRGIAIYRYNLLPRDIDEVMVTVKKLYSMGIMFDMKFDLASNDRMYCAEFVYKSFVMGANGKLVFHISRLGDFAFIGVDDLFLQPDCKTIKKILY